MLPVRSKETHCMALQLYFHPFSSYCQKALVALYENAVPFEGQLLEGPDCAASRQLAELWPMKRFPVLVDGDRTIIEATCIIEYVGLRMPGPVRRPIGRTRSARPIPTSLPTVAACCSDHRLPGRWTKPGRIAATFRWALPIAIETD